MGEALAILHLVAASRRRRREQWYAPDRLRSLRLARLRRLIEIARRAPYYRETFARAGLGPNDLVDESALERLPLLEKAALQENQGSALLTRPPAGLFPIATSGSTGLPLRLLRSPRDQAEISAQWARLFHAYGRRLWDRQVNLASGRVVAKRGPAALLRAVGLLPALHQLASFEPLEHQIAVLRKVRPQMISAYAIGLELLAEGLLQAGVTDIRLRIIYTTGTPLTARCRRLAAEAFGVEPFDVYATNEVGPIAWECPVSRGRLHLNEDVQITEIVDDDGRRMPDGASGHVVVTQLLCAAEPLIRYRIGDSASREEGRCQCGRGLGLLGPVLGRSQHVIRAPDGRVINAVTVSSILAGAPEVRRYQVRQTGPRELMILVLPSGSWRDDSAAAIEARFRDRLGDAFSYRVDRVDEIPLAPSGKFQSIVPLTS